MLVTALNVAWAASRRASVRKFNAALANPERAQASWLAKFLKANAQTAYGRAHGYGDLHSVTGFQQRVPVVDYEALSPWVERIADGEPGVLTYEPVKMLERTSGTSAAAKLIPYTAGLLGDFGAATGPWLDDVTRAFPRMLTARHYWSVSPAARAPEVTKGGLRIGLEDDTEYFDPLTRAAMKRLFAVDGSVARLADVETWRRETLRALLRADDLGFISVWNPSFLTLLMNALERDWASLRDELPRARRAEVEAKGLSGEALWPRLQVISCWTDAWAAQASPALRKWFPRTPFQGKGLLATEGVVTFPLWGQAAPVAAVTSHFLEFEPVDGGAPVLVHQLREGATYSPLLTTRGGFARYRLADVLRCVGFVRATPLLRFEGRLDRTSDLRGEKLSAVFVENALRAVGVDGFALVAPVLGEPPHYALFAEHADQHLTERLERALLENPHYRYARELGQLGPLQLERVRGGAEKYMAALRARGLRLGDIKPSGFDTSTDWGARLG